MTGITGYRIDYGTNSASLNLSTTVSGANSTSVTINNLGAGTYYFKIVVLSSGGASAPSNVVTRVFP